MSAEATDRNVSTTTTLTAPAPTAVDGIREAIAAVVADYSTDLSRRWARVSQGTARFVRRQTEFNQVARFILAIPLAVATPTYTGFDTRPLVPPSEIAGSSQPAAASSLSPQVIRPADTVNRGAVASPGDPNPADVVPGPRVRAICSRSGQTVFLDDRVEVEAPADWREDVSQRHPGAVCAFTNRFGVAEPQFKAIDVNMMPTAVPADTASRSDDIPPTSVKTISITTDTSTRAELRGFAVPADGPDPAKEQIERALAALSAPSQPAGARVAPSVALAASTAMTIPLPEPRPLPRGDLGFAAIEPASATNIGVSNVTTASAWVGDAMPIRHAIDLFRLLDGQSDSFIALGAYGQDEQSDQSRAASTLMPTPFASRSSLEFTVGSPFRDLARMAGPQRFSWTRPDGLVTYPSLVLPWPKVRLSDDRTSNLGVRRLPESGREGAPSDL